MFKLQPTLHNLTLQLSMELQASHDYLQMHLWCEINNYKGFAKYMLNASNEERGHAMLIKDYAINFAGALNTGYVTISTLTVPRSFNSILDIMQQILKLEIEVTTSINNIIADSYNVGDYATAAFLGKLAEEQVKGLNEVNYILKKIEICNNDQAAILLLDEEVGKIG